MKCPFSGKERVVCDLIGASAETGMVQCPTPIFNACQICGDKELEHKYTDTIESSKQFNVKEWLKENGID